MNPRQSARIITINILVLAALLAIIELSIKIFCPSVHLQWDDAHLYEAGKYGDTYGFKADSTGHLQGARIWTDKNGFRIDPSLSVDPNGRGLLFLGDSITQSVGVDAPDAFPYIVQRSLQGHIIYNAAGPGHGVNDYYQVLATLAPRMSFDGVVVGLCLNDFSEASKSSILSNLSAKPDDYELRYPNPLLRLLKRHSVGAMDFIKFLRKHSRTYYLVKGLVTDTPKNYFQAEMAFYEDPKALSTMRDGLRLIRDIAKRNGKWTILLIFPFEYQLRQDSFDTDKPQSIYREIAREEGLDIIDMLPRMKEDMTRTRRPSKDYYLFDDGVHFSPVGHRLIATTLLSELSKRKPIGTNLTRQRPNE